MYGTRIYVPVASYCDKANADGFLADGRLVAVDIVDATIVATFDVVPGRNNMGGMWGYAGTTIDPATGHLFTATGNSWVFDPECGCILEDVDYGESLVELDPDLHVIAANRPEGVGSRGWSRRRGDRARSGGRACSPRPAAGGQGCSAAGQGNDRSDRPLQQLRRRLRARRPRGGWARHDDRGRRLQRHPC